MHWRLRMNEAEARWPGDVRWERDIETQQAVSRSIFADPLSELQPSGVGHEGQRSQGDDFRSIRKRDHCRNRPHMTNTRRGYWESNDQDRMFISFSTNNLTGLTSPIWICSKTRHRMYKHTSSYPKPIYTSPMKSDPASWLTRSRGRPARSSRRIAPSNAPASTYPLLEPSPPPAMPPPATCAVIVITCRWWWGN